MAEVKGLGRRITKLLAYFLVILSSSMIVIFTGTILYLEWVSPSSVTRVTLSQFLNLLYSSLVLATFPTLFVSLILAVPRTGRLASRIHQKLVTEVSLEKRERIAQTIAFVRVPLTLLTIPILIVLFLAGKSSSLFLAVTAAIIAIYFILAIGGIMVSPYERATVRWRQFRDEISLWLEEHTRVPSSTNFEEGLRSYDASLPNSVFLKSIGHRVAEMELILNMGTDEELREICKRLSNLVQALDDQKTDLIERNLLETTNFIDRFVEQRERIYEIRIPIKEKMRTRLPKLVGETLIRTIPILFALFVAYVLYVLFGMPIPSIL